MLSYILNDAEILCPNYANVGIQLALLSQAEGARDIVSKYSNLCISTTKFPLHCCSIESTKAEPITSIFHPSSVITDYPHSCRAFNQMKRGRAQSQGNDVTVNAMIVSAPLYCNSIHDTTPARNMTCQEYASFVLLYTNRSYLPRGQS